MPTKITKITQIEYKRMPKFTITYGISDTPFGKCLMGLHSNTLCYAQIFDVEPPMDKFKRFWPKAELVRDDMHIAAVSDKLFSNDMEADNFPVTLKGTSFQMEVWEALVNVKRGSTVSYEGLAVNMGHPRTLTRSVANAVASNNIVYFIPCHRVISKSGALHKFGCGVHKKFMMLEHEDAVPESAKGMF